MPDKEQQQSNRLSMNLTLRAQQALGHVTGLTGNTKTETVNRAVIAYDMLEDVIARGGDVLIREPGEPEMYRLRFA